ncbi:MAG TPA: S8 family serine peptidase [Bacilli bacterium]|nr:S8 family serine peptidase [Bacilli bacterium]
MKKRLAFAVMAATLALGTAGISSTTTTQKAYASTNLLVDTALVNQLDSMVDLDSTKIILTFTSKPTLADLDLLKGLGITAGTRLNSLPMVITTATKAQIDNLLQANIPNLVSVYADKQLEYFLDQSVHKIGADRVWSDPALGFTGKGIGVAVVDSGIDGTHPGLTYGTRTVQNVKVVDDLVTDFISPVYLENLPDTDNAGGHGTHCAGIIGGDGAGSDGKYKGVAPESNLIGVSSGAAILVTTALEGLDYVLTNKDRYNIQVVSNSWGTSDTPYDPNDPINVASKQLHDAGVTVVFAAGNDGPGDNTLNPYSVAPWVIGVAAGTKTEETALADFSSRGIFGDPLYHPTITAPGMDIVSAKAKESVLSPLSLQTDLTMIPVEYQPYYTTMSGTSMATPHIAGVLALMEQADPDLTPDEAKQYLIDTATPMPDYDEYEVGAGFVNAYDAVTLAKQGQ